MLVPSVELDVLHGVAEAELVHARAAHHVGTHFHNGQLIDELLRIRLMGVQRNL